MRWFHQDQLGSTRALTDASGATVATYDYDAFGALRRESGPAASANHFRFTGQYSDDSGHVYLRARWYDPATGQFLSRDPVGFDGGSQNVYAYAANNPMNLVDPSGLWPSLEDISNSAAGFGDTVTLGATKAIRQALGVDNVNYCSDAYGAGGYTGVAVEVATGVGGVVKVAGKVVGKQGLRQLGRRLSDETGSIGIPSGDLPRRARTFADFDAAAAHLAKHHGVDPLDASRRIHALKDGYRGGENLLIDRTGNVYNPYTREKLGTLTKDA